MSSGNYEAHKAAEQWKYYDNALKGIKSLSVEELISMFNIDSFSQPNIERDLLEKLQHEVGEYGTFCVEYGSGYYMRKPGEFDVKVPIPGYMNVETFRGTSLRPLLVKAISFLRWCKTDIGKKVLENLD